jgi:hypothetical protein
MTRISRPHPGVAYQNPNGVNSSATAAAVGKSGTFVVPVVSRLARDHRLPYETPPASFAAHELAKMERVVRENHSAIMEAWNDFLRRRD